MCNTVGWLAIAHHLYNYVEHTEIITIIIIITRKLITLVVQRPHDIRYWIDPLTAGFKDEVKWWSGMELGRRLLFLLFIVSFPKNTVSNNNSINYHYSINR